MDTVQNSFIFLFLFLMECPLHLCMPYAGNKLLQRSRNGTNHPTVSSLHGTRVSRTHMKSFRHKGHRNEEHRPEPTMNNHGFIAHSVDLRSDTWDTALIPHRPALVRVIIAACIAISVALLGGIAVFCVVHRLVQAEERQQLALLYKNVRIPWSGDEAEGSEDEGQDESTYLLPENEKELEKFIHSVIKSKRRKITEKKKLSEKQKLKKERKIPSAAHHTTNGTFVKAN